jgi:hypothetical protein
LQAQQAAANQPPHPNGKVIETMAYKDLPADIQRQMEEAAGFVPSKIGGSSTLEHKAADTITSLVKAPATPPAAVPAQSERKVR